MSSAPATASATVRALIDEAHARLKRARVAFGHGTTKAWDEAVYLVLHALGLPPDRLTPYLARRVSAAECERARRLVAERIRRRVPAAYLTHEAWLGPYRFYVDERVIVPRSYLADLLREGLTPWVARPERIARSLDLGTGSGCLAILLAKMFPAARVDAVDVSPAALAVARRNVAAYRLQRRIRLARSDLFSALGGRRYDLIVANPPYVRAAVMRKLPAEYRHEPRLALAGGADGFDAVRAILRAAARHLSAGGLLVVEVGDNRRRLERAFPRLPFVWPHTASGADRVFMLACRDLTRSAGAALAPRRASRAGAGSRRRGVHSTARV